MSTTVVGCKEWAVKQFSEALLGDVRRTERLVRVAEAIAAKPGKSLPEALGDWKSLKAAYRFFDNDEATHERVTRPHLDRTRAACRAGGEYLMVEDTTTLSYCGRQVEGLGPVSDDLSTNGILLHSTLALRVERWLPGGDLEVTVEGLFAQRPWVRKRVKRKGETKRQRLSRRRESERWAEVFDETGGPGDGCRWTFVADREGDIFRVMADCAGHGVDFIIRAMQPRRLKGREGSPFDAVTEARPLGRFTVDLRARPGVPARQATVEVRAARVTLRPPKNGGKGFGPEPVTVVEAREVDAPEGVEPIHWVLLTSWRVEGFEDAMRVVKAYTKRWLIEEYHKALKTGAGIEQTQLEKRERIETLLGILAVVAVRLLNMKLLARSRPDDAAPEGAMGPEAFRILKARSGEPDGCWTNRDLIVGIAKLGGFLARKSDGDPGWITIWRGWRNLMLMIEGSRYYRSERCVQ